MTTCRRCTECVGQEHHWLPLPEEGDDGSAFFPCKHCNTTAPVCQRCFDDVADSWGPHGLCPTCRSETT